MQNELIINFCPTGMIPVSNVTQNVPMTPQHIIEDVHRAYELGITIAHLHARSENQSPTHRIEVFAKIFEGVRKHCPDLVISASLSGRSVSDWSLRSEVLSLKPDMGSLTLSSLNFPREASVNSPETIQNLALAMKDQGVTPELECFDLGMINYGKYLIQKGILEGPYYWNLLFGNIAGAQSDPLSVGTLIRETPSEGHITLAGIGNAQLPINTIAIAMGYGVRVGLEDNLWFDSKRTQPATNIQLIERIHQIAEIHERKIMPPEKLGQQGYYNKTSSQHSTLSP